MKISPTIKRARLCLAFALRRSRCLILRFAVGGTKDDAVAFVATDFLVRRLLVLPPAGGFMVN